MKLVTLVLQGSIWVKNGWDPYNAKVTNYMKNNVSQEEEGMKGKPVNIGSLSHCRKFRRILHYLLFLQFICIVTDFQILNSFQGHGAACSTFAIVPKTRFSIINNWLLVLSSIEGIITARLCTLISNTEWSAGCN